MLSLNRAQIIGNLTRDPEVRYTTSGHPVAHFGVATNRRWNNQSGERQEETEFHEIVAWGKLSEIISQILHKGQKVYVEGRLQTRSWEAPDGSKRQRTEIVADNFVSLAPRGEFQPLDKSLDKSPDKPLDKPLDKSLDKSPDKPLDKSLDKSPETPAETAEDNDDLDSLEDIPF